MSAELVRTWVHNSTQAGFPFEAVLAEYQPTGKHFVSDDLLKCLDAAHTNVADGRCLDTERILIATFLDVALDKFDGRYDYPSYIGLPLLGLPGIESVLTGRGMSRSRHRELFSHLLADVVRFELASLKGAHDRLPQRRATPPVVRKRCHVAVRLFRDHGHDVTREYGSADDPLAVVGRVCDSVIERASVADRRAVALSMMPVYIIHDEYMFIRTLQMLETSFNMLAGDLLRAIDALSRSAVTAAVDALTSAAQTLSLVAPLFTFLATMDVESFRTFRTFTEGASAIQSRNYKLAEALCRAPAEDRLASPAYESVPEVRRLIGARIPTISEAVAAHLGSAQGDQQDGALVKALDAFSSAMRHRRNTHYRLARRMLGDVRGTGYTEGVPYLRDVIDIPVFTLPPG